MRYEPGCTPVNVKAPDASVDAVNLNDGTSTLARMTVAFGIGTISGSSTEPRTVAEPCCPSGGTCGNATVTPAHNSARRSLRHVTSTVWHRVQVDVEWR